MTSASDEAPQRLGVGTRVEVRTGFDRSWARGYEVAEDTGDGYRIVRRSDGAVLPVVFADDAVRKEHKRSMWWI